MQSIDINGTSLTYRERGNGEPMVLVHANISDVRSWEPLEPLVAKHFRVISYSRRHAFGSQSIGAGEDDPLERHADDLVALIEALRLGKVHLVGNSSGAFISLLAARKRSDLVRTLTLEEPPVISMFLPTLPPQFATVVRLLFTSPSALFDFIRFGAGTIAPAVKAFQTGRSEEALDIFARGVLGKSAFARVTAERKQQMKDNLAPHRAALLGSGLPVFTAEDAAAIKVPTQLLRGVNTPSFQRRINQRLAALIPGARDVSIASASHLVHEDNPHAVAEAIREFCNEAER